MLTLVSRRSIMAAAAVLVSVVLGGTGLTVVLLRDVALERAKENFSNLATLLAEQAQRSIQSVDLVVSATASDFAAAQAGGGITAQVLHDRLRERWAAAPELEYLAVLDKSGSMVNDSRAVPAAPANYADRDFFTAVRDAPRGAGLHVGAPAPGLSSSGPRQTYSRRINGPRGEFLGVVLAVFRANHLNSFFRTLRLGAGGQVAIFRADGVLLNSYPHVERAIGRTYAGDSLFNTTLEASENGVVRRGGIFDTEPRLIAYESLRGRPVVVTVSATERHVLADWREGATTAGGMAGGVSFIIGLTAFLLLRQKTQDTALRGEIRISGERLLGVLQSTMDAIITVDGSQSIVLFNAAAERIFGCPAAAAVGATLDRFIPERYREAHRGHVSQFGATGVSTRHMGASRVLFGLRANGEEFPIDASISQVESDGGKLYTVILRDVSERRNAELALQQAFHERRSANEQLSGIIGSAMDAIVTVDRRQRVVLFNEAAERIFRCTAGAAVGQPLERLIPERFRAAHARHIERFGETRVTTRAMGARLELYGLRADGEEFPIDASISQVTVDGERFYTVILRDVTERKTAEAALERSYRELRELSVVMNEVREAERTRIARELHDELAQLLTALKMDLAWLASRLAPEQRNLVARGEKMKGLVDQTVASVRRIAADLRPVMLDDLGLLPSIEHLLHSLSDRADVIVSLEAPEERIDLRDPLATAIYRMVQEALTNVARHARATEVRVAIALEQGVLQVRVIDNGVGLPAAPAERKSYGLLGIRERAQTLGGSATIHSPPGGGTVVEISLPMERYGAGPKERTP